MTTETHAVAHVAILGDSPLLCESLATAVALQGAGTATTARTLRELLEVDRRSAVNVVLVRIGLCGEDLRDLVQEVRLLLSEAVVIVLGVDNANQSSALRLVEAGASGCLPHEVSLTEVVRAIRTGARHGACGSLALLQAAASHLQQARSSGPSSSSSRGSAGATQQETVALLRLGMTNKEISRHLGISLSATKLRVRTALRRQGECRKQLMINGRQEC